MAKSKLITNSCFSTSNKKDGTIDIDRPLLLLCTKIHFGAGTQYPGFCIACFCAPVKTSPPD